MNWPQAFGRSGPPSDESARRRWTRTGLKVLGAIVLLAVLLSVAKPGRALQYLRQADAGLVALAVAVLVLQVSVAAVRWHAISRVFAPGASLADMLRFSYVAQFFNQLLPASVGGDAARVWLLHTRGPGLRSAILATSADRFFGLFSLFAVTAGSLLAFRSQLGSLPLWGAGLAISSAGVAASLGLLAAARLPERWASRWQAARLVVDLGRGLCRLLASARSGATVLGASLLVHAMSVISVWLLALGVGLHVELPLLMVGVPVSLLAATLPISIGGWGLREGTLVAILAAHGTDVDRALAVSLLFGLSLLAVGLVGALGWIGLRTTQPDAS